MYLAGKLNLKIIVHPEVQKFSSTSDYRPVYYVTLCTLCHRKTQSVGYIFFVKS